MSDVISQKQVNDESSSICSDQNEDLDIKEAKSGTNTSSRQNNESVCQLEMENAASNNIENRQNTCVIISREDTSMELQPTPTDENREFLSQSLDRDSFRRRTATIAEVKEQASSRLVEELQRAQEELKLKDEECEKLSRVRLQIENELGELTASLFEEAHEMVRAANIKQLHAEKHLAEADGKIDVLTAEVSALKALVLTSTPSSPNPLLHPQLGDAGKKSSGFFKGHKRSPSHNDIKRSNSLKGSNGVGATGVVSPLAMNIEQRQQQIERGAAESPEQIEVDPVVYEELVSWKDSPDLDNPSSPFLQRVLSTDVSPCLQFTCCQLAVKVQKAVEDNALMIEPIHGNNTFPSPTEDSIFVRRCALSNELRVCKYRMQLSNVDSTWFYICKFARDRLAAVCDFFTYLRYIHQGLVKAETKDVYYEIVRLRKRMALARLGVLNLP